MALNNFGLGMTVQATDEASAVLAKVGDHVGGVSKKSKEASTSMQDVQGEMSSLGTKMMGAGLAVGAGLAYAASQAADFQRGMTELGTLVPHTQFSMEDMNKTVRDMMQTFGGDSKTQIAAMYQAISAGATDAAKANQIMTAANQLAIAGATDQKTALLGLTKVLNNFNMDFGQSSKVADAFLTAVQGGSTTMGELGNAIGDVAAGAKNSGISMQELIGALGTGATLLKDTASAATGLKAAMMGVAHPTADAAAEAARLGVKFNAASLRSKGLVGFMKEITTSARFNADSFSKLFGSLEASNFMTALAADNMGALSTMMGSMDGNAGKAQAAFDEMSKTMSQQLSVLKANLELVGVEIGTALAPITGFLVEKLKDAAKWFVNLSAPVKKIITYAAVAFSAFMTLAGGALMTGVAVAGLIVAAKAIAIGLAVAVGAVVALAAVMAPLIVLAYGLRQAWTNNIGGMATKVTAWFDKIHFAFTALSDLFSNGGFSESVFKELDKAENSGVKEFAINTFLWFNRIKNFFSGLADGFSTVLTKAAPVIDTMVKAFEKLGAVLFGSTVDAPEQARSAFNTFGAVGNKIGTILAKVFTFVAEAVGDVVTIAGIAIDAFKFFAPTLSTIWGSVSKLGDAFGTLGTAIFGADQAGAESGKNWQTVGAVIGMVASGIGYAFMGVVGVITVAVTYISALIDGVKQIFFGLWNYVQGVFNLIAGVLTGDWAQAWKGAKQIVFGTVQAIIGILVALVGQIFGLVDGIAKTFGKDLGLQKALAGGANDMLKDLSGKMGLQGQVALPSVAGSTAGSPAVASAQGSAANSAAIAAAVSSTPAAKPADVNVSSVLVVDGAVLATAVKKAGAQDANRSFAPTLAPT